MPIPIMIDPGCEEELDRLSRQAIARPDTLVAQWRGHSIVIGLADASGNELFTNEPLAWSLPASRRRRLRPDWWMLGFGLLWLSSVGVCAQCLFQIAQW